MRQLAPVGNDGPENNEIVNTPISVYVAVMNETTLGVDVHVLALIGGERIGADVHVGGSDSTNPNLRYVYLKLHVCPPIGLDIVAVLISV
jgi:hypothetical protein